MADSPGEATRRSVWHGHTLRPLPEGESWFSGGERRPRPPEPIRYPALEPSLPGDRWPFDEWDLAAAGSGGHTSAPASPALQPNTRRAVTLLILVSLAAIATILLARRSGAPPEPAPLPAPPSRTITGVSRAHPASATIRVGDYLEFRLPSGHTYSTVLEQPPSQVPVVEALTLPGQQPQLRADSAGHAVIEVMSAPLCHQPDGCPDQRSLLGTVDLTVAP